MDIRINSKLFFEEYINLCKKHKIIFLSQEKTPSSMMFATLQNEKFMFESDFMSLEDFSKEVENIFFKK